MAKRQTHKKSLFPSFSHIFIIVDVIDFHADEISSRSRAAATRAVRYFFNFF
jgi:hypothetical protein